MISYCLEMQETTGSTKKVTSLCSWLYNREIEAQVVLAWIQSQLFPLCQAASQLEDRCRSRERELYQGHLECRTVPTDHSDLHIGGSTSWSWKTKERITLLSSLLLLLLVLLLLLFLGNF